MTPPFDYRRHNRSAWNRFAKEGNRFARPATDSDFLTPLASVDGPGWLGGTVSGKRVLCLAAGGGRQGPLYAAAGADVTVVDISDEMLCIDQQVSLERGLNVKTIRTSMEDLSMLADQSFEIVIQPVSTCYVPTLGQVYSEVARVTTDSGLYISQHKQPASLQSSVTPNRRGHYSVLHENRADGPLPEPEVPGLIRESGTCEFVHAWQAIIGDLCQSGFVVEELIEPDHADVAAAPGSFEHRCRFIRPYVRIKARRLRRNQIDNGNSPIWIPE